MMRCFVAGTDTGVGKTTFTAALLSTWVAMGGRTAGFKPICTGTREDAELLQSSVTKKLDLDVINPLHFSQPLSPWIAAKLDKRTIDLDQIAQRILESMETFTHIAVEGAGGWLTPVSANETMADLARKLGLPVVVVTKNTLGTLNHTLLTVAGIRSTGLPILGLVINHHLSHDDLTERTNPAALAELTGLPCFSLRSHPQIFSGLPPWLGGRVGEGR